MQQYIFRNEIRAFFFSVLSFCVLTTFTKNCTSIVSPRKAAPLVRGSSSRLFFHDAIIHQRVQNILVISNVSCYHQCVDNSVPIQTPEANKLMEINCIPQHATETTLILYVSHISLLSQRLIRATSAGKVDERIPFITRIAVTIMTIKVTRFKTVPV